MNTKPELLTSTDSPNKSLLEAREAELASLQRSEDRYRRLFEAAQDGILILEEEGGYIADANPFLTGFLGYTRDELLGKQLWEIGLFKDIDANREAFRVLKEKGYIRYDNLPLKSRAGLALEVEFVSNVYDVGDERVIQCNIRDITERRRAERSLRVIEETLRQSKKLEAMGRLTGGIAHDFNNVLTAIDGYAGLALLLVEKGGTAHGYIAEILKAGERAASLTHQLLAFSRQQILAPKILRLNSIVSDMHGMLTRVIGDSISIRMDLDPGLGRVKADPVQMEQILMNLSINARDAMPDGGEIVITTRNAEMDSRFTADHPGMEPGAYVVLSVGDTGMGMDADVKARIFDPFFTTKPVGKGTGMGLATVHGIVEQSGGQITVDSAPGKGTTFHVFLPRTDKEEERPALPPAAGPPAGRGFETILLTEDDAMVRALIRTVLEGYGYTVLEAENGAAAMVLSRTHAGPINLLMTDLMMPGINGRQLSRTFLLEHPVSNVIFMSGYTDDFVMQQALMEDGEHFIQKPFSPLKLAEMVRGVLEGTLSEAV